MNWLLLDTACPRAMVAIVCQGKIQAEIYLDETLKHGEKLAAAIEDCLKKAELDIGQLNGVAVGKGPGSFIGVRVAIAHAKGICMALQIPLVGICTLSAIAAAFDFPVEEGMVFLDARRGEFYVRHIKRTWHEGRLQVMALEDPAILSLDDVKALGLKERTGGFYTLTDKTTYYEKLGVLGEGMLLMLQQHLEETPVPELNEVFSLTPTYVRAPDAKVLLKRSEVTYSKVQT